MTASFQQSWEPFFANPGLRNFHRPVSDQVSWKTRESNLWCLRIPLHTLLLTLSHASLQFSNGYARLTWIPLKTSKSSNWAFQILRPSFCSKDSVSPFYCNPTSIPKCHNSKVTPPKWWLCGLSKLPLSLELLSKGLHSADHSRLLLPWWWFAILTRFLPPCNWLNLTQRRKRPGERDSVALLIQKAPLWRQNNRWSWTSNW